MPIKLIYFGNPQTCLHRTEHSLTMPRKVNFSLDPFYCSLTLGAEFLYMSWKTKSSVYTIEKTRWLETPLRPVHPPANTLLAWDSGQRFGTLLRKLDVGYRPPVFGVSPIQETWGPRKSLFPSFPESRRTLLRIASHTGHPSRAPLGGPCPRAKELADTAPGPQHTLRDRLCPLLDTPHPPAGAVFQPSLLAMCEVQIRLISSVSYQGQIFQMFTKTSFLSTGCLRSTSRYNTKS